MKSSFYENSSEHVYLEFCTNIPLPIVSILLGA